MQGIIYIAVNRANGKIYVGQTTREFHIRIREHVYDSVNKAKQPFHRAIGKYGIDGFDIAILETCSLLQVEEREKYWIKMFPCRKPSGYNVTSGGEGSPGIKRPDVTARLKAMTGERNHMFGRKFTPEERKKFGQPGARNARFGVKLDPEFRKIISERTKAAMATPEIRARFLASCGPMSDATKEKLSIAQKRFQKEKRGNKHAIAC